MPTKTGQGEIAQTLDRGLQVLELVAQSADGLSVTEVATDLGVSRSVAARLLYTLLHRGYLSRGHAGRYRLGLRVFSLARLSSTDLTRVATPLLADIAERFDLTALLHLAEGNESVTLLSIEPQHATFHLGLRTGSRHPLELAAHGRAILAGRPAHDQEPAAVTEARARGFAESTGEVVPNSTGISVPVVVHNWCDASVGVVFPTGRDRHDQTLVAELTAVAEKIAAGIG